MDDSMYEFFHDPSDYADFIFELEEARKSIKQKPLMGLLKDREVARVEIERGCVSCRYAHVRKKMFCARHGCRIEQSDLDVSTCPQYVVDRDPAAKMALMSELIDRAKRKSVKRILEEMDANLCGMQKGLGGSKPKVDKAIDIVLAEIRLSLTAIVELNNG